MPSRFMGRDGMAEGNAPGPPIHTRFYRMQHTYAGSVAEAAQLAVLLRFAAPGGNPLECLPDESTFLGLTKDSYVRSD